MFLQTAEADSAEAVCAGALGQYPDDANFLCLSARALLLLEPLLAKLPESERPI